MQDKHDGMRNSLTIEMDQQRIAKDARHAQLEDDFENHRNQTTLQINGHTESIQMLESIKLNLKSTIMGHEQTIHQKRDVEDHHA
jgi:hypothetical protein